MIIDSDVEGSHCDTGGGGVSKSREELGTQSVGPRGVGLQPPLGQSHLPEDLLLSPHRQDGAEVPERGREGGEGGGLHAGEHHLDGSRCVR